MVLTSCETAATRILDEGVVSQVKGEFVITYTYLKQAVPPHLWRMWLVKQIKWG